MSQISKQEITQKKQFLYSYKNNKKRLTRLEEKLSLLNERITSIKSPNLSGMPRGGIPVTLDDLLSDKDILQNRIKKLKVKCESIKKDILNEIDKLEDIRYSEVLELYFISDLSFDDIGDELGYTTRHVLRLYTRGVNQLINISNRTV